MENIYTEIIMIKKNSVFLFHRPNPCQDRQDFLSVPPPTPSVYALLSTILPWHHTVYYYYYYYYYFCYSITRRFVPPVEYQIHNRNTYIKTTIYIAFCIYNLFSPSVFLRIKKKLKLYNVLYYYYCICPYIIYNTYIYV